MARVKTAGKASGVKSDPMPIDADIAREFLSREKPPAAGVAGTNRKSGQGTVREYANAMLRGEWELTHQGIAFNEDGEMVDGGHRLRALLLADSEQPGITIEMMVTTGLSNKARLAMDTGRRRVPSDFLRMLGKTNTSSLGGILRLVYCYYNVPWSHIETWSRHRITPRMQEDFLNEHPGLEDAVAETFALKKIFKASALGAFWYIVKTERPDLDVAEFLEELRSGELLQKGDPALTLRELMLNSKGALRRFEASEELALLIKAFNKWVKEEESQLLAFRSNEAFPRITTA